MDIKGKRKGQQKWIMQLRTWNMEQRLKHKCDIKNLKELKLDIITLKELKKKSNELRTIGGFIHFYSGIRKEMQAKRRNL
jgi:hypothetical protein